MKILAVSLLRLGDIIMLGPAIAEIKKKFPEAEIHMLMNRQFASVSQLLVGIDKYIYFDRDEIQQSMGDSRRSLFEAYDRLSDLIDDLNSQGYHTVYNFTHNRLSAWLCSLIQSEYIQGLSYNESGRPQFGSSWFRQLNSQTDSEAQAPFHLIDIFKEAVSISGTENEWSLKETADGILESADVLPRMSGILAVQPLTSDVKKNWGLSNYAQTIKTIRRQHPQIPIAILCSPSERSAVESEFKSMVDERTQIAELSLPGIISLFKRCRMLLTGDTSIKHLAAGTNLRTLELVLGSSDHRFTGVYQHGSVMVRSKVECAPCVHSRPCHQAEQICSKSIPVDLISMLTQEIYQGYYHQLPAIAEEYADQVELFRVDIKTTKMWHAIEIPGRFTEQAVGSIIDRYTRRLLLRERDDRRIELTIGSETLQLLQLLRNAYPGIAANDWKYLFAELDRQVRLIDGRMNSLKLGLKHLASQFEDTKKIAEFVRSLSGLRQQMQTLPFLRSMAGLLEIVIEDDISVPFVRVRKFADILAQIERQSRLSLKVSRILESEFGTSIVEEKIHES